MSQDQRNFFHRKMNAEERSKKTRILGLGLTGVLALGGVLTPIVSGLSTWLGSLLALVAAAIAFRASSLLSLRVASENSDESTPCKAEKWTSIVLWIVLFFLVAMGRLTETLIPTALLGLVLFWLLRQVAAIPHDDLAKQGSGRRFEEVKNVDSIAGLLVAVIAIVVAYGYGLRAFQIPTGSMEPTLFGKPLTGERAIINLAHYSLTEPKRGDITVFRFPMARGQDYVKRTIGTGGETILIYHGDVYIQGEEDAYPKIWRKEGGLRESLWLELAEGQAFDKGIGGITGKKDQDGDALVLSPSNGKDGAMRFPKEGVLKDHDPSAEVDPNRADLHNTDHVSDGRVRTNFSLNEGATFELVFHSNKQITTFSLTDGATPSVKVERAGKLLVEGALEGTLSSDQEYALACGVADGEVFFTLDGQTLAERLTFATPLESILQQKAEAGTLDQELAFLGGAGLLGDEKRRNAFNDVGLYIEFRAKASGVRLTESAIDRDIHYLGRRLESFDAKGKVELSKSASLPYLHRVADDSYFMLGDHSQDSLDSRAWFLATLEVDGNTWKFPFNAFFDFSKGGPSKETIKLYIDARNALQGLLAKDAEAKALAAFDESIKSGGLGIQFKMKDIFGIEREFRSTKISAVSIAAAPDVAENLVVGPLLGSLFPRPRFID